jgi:FkbM family methyltransferase
MSAFLKVYEIAERSGLMKQGWFQSLYTWCYFKYKRHFEDPFFRLSQDRPDLFAGGHVLDVGANIGYTASIFASVVGTPFKVHAFEPEKSCFDQLCLIASKYATIVPVQSAVGTESGTTTIWKNESHKADHRVVTAKFSEVVSDQSSALQTSPIVSIDDYVDRELNKESISFIKIDVQGYEQKVLEGAVQTIANNPEVTVAFEYSPDSARELGFTPELLFQFFEELQFNLFAISPNSECVPLSESLRAELLRKRGYFDVLATRRDL